ncbi:MAG: hypothetical protein Q7S61_03195 [bacterium]|nr:hypothetical protein [bacterium]
MKKIILFLALALLLSKLFLINPLTTIIGDGWINGGDSYEYFGFQNIVRENILHLSHPFSYTTTLRYPVGFDFSYGFDGALPVLFGGILSLLISLPLAYNLTIVFILFFNMWLTYLFFTSLSSHGTKQTKLASFASAIICGASPYVIARTFSHLNLAFVAGFPLVGLAVVQMYRAFQEKRTLHMSHWLLLFSGILLVAGGSLQYLILAIEVIAGGLVLVLYVRPESIGSLGRFIYENIIKHPLSFLIPVVLVISIFLFLFYGYIDAVVHNKIHTIDRTQSLAKCCQPIAADFFIPNKYLGSVGNFIASSPSIEKVASLGIVGWILLGISFFALHKKLKQILIVAFVLFLTIGMGLLPLPFIPENGRVIVAFGFVAAICVYLFLRKIPAWIIGFVIALLILERLTFSFYSSPLFPPDASKIIQEQPGQAVLHLPLDRYQTLYSALPYFYGKKIVDGYFHWTAATEKSNEFLNSTIPQMLECTSQGINVSGHELANFLKTHNIRTIVIYKDTQKSRWYFTECTKLRDSWNALYPKNVTVSTSTEGVEPAHIELSNVKQFHTELRFEKDGNVSLSGLLIYPRFLTDTYIQLPDGSVIQPDFKNTYDGITHTFDPPQNVQIHAGDTITIASPQPIHEPVYFTAFYSFQEDSQSVSKKKDFSTLYEDDRFEVIAVN